jgi:hypothetical protein
MPETPPNEKGTGYICPADTPLFNTR